MYVGVADLTLYTILCLYFELEQARDTKLGTITGSNVLILHMKFDLKQPIGGAVIK